MALRKPKQLNSRFVLVACAMSAGPTRSPTASAEGAWGGNLRVGAGFRKPAPTLLLDHLGRKSGKRFTTPLRRIRPTLRNGRDCGRALWTPTPTSTRTRAGPTARSPCSSSSPGSPIG
jgi:hypothetical protein